jgi:hypothetical protein
MKSKVLALAAVAGSLMAGQAQAAVTYKFESEIGSFTYLSADFVTGLRYVDPADLTACASVRGGCWITFFPDIIAPRPEASLGFETRVTNQPSIETFFFFAPGAFSAPGVYSALLNGEIASLTVSGAPGPLPTISVPEPGTWALMIAGFGLAGATLRRRQGAPQAA